MLSVQHEKKCYEVLYSKDFDFEEQAYMYGEEEIALSANTFEPTGYYVEALE